MSRTNNYKSTATYHGRAVLPHVEPSIVNDRPMLRSVMPGKLLRGPLLAVVLLLIASGAAPKRPAQSSPPTAGNYRTVFRLGPLKALEVATQLPSSAKPAICNLELALLKDASDGHLHRWSLPEGALIVCGATTEAGRRRYLAQLDKIEQQSREATAGSDGPTAKAKALLHFLHTQPMRGGYVKDQSNLCVLLDTGRYNCLSSTVLYNLIALRLGLDVHAVLMPEHVFCTMRADNGNIDIATTTDHSIFSSKTRLERVRKIIAKDHIKVGPAFRTKLYREIGNLDLLAQMYFNQSAELSKKERHRDALLADLKSLCLDSKEARSVNRVQGKFETLFRLAMQKHRYGEARSIAQHYKQLLHNPQAADRMVRKLALARAG